MAWTDVARAQHGMITRRQLRALGVTDRRVDGLLAAGTLRVYRRQGLFCAAAVAPTTMTACWSAVLAARATLSHHSAAYVWGIDTPGDGRLHVTVPQRRYTRMPAGVRVHRVLLPDDATVEHDGLPVTARSRTVLDCVGMLRRAEARTLLDRALQKQWTTVAQLDHRLRTEPKRRGNAILRLLLDEVVAGDSYAERLLHDILEAAGITGWQPNLPIDLGSFRLTVDVGFPDHRVVLEVDGWAYHQDVTRFRADRRRDNELRHAGWQVYRFTLDMLVERPGEVVRIVSGALRASPPSPR